ncbi:MAG TPA: hypothetical protein VLK65_21790 [Vicinamibacteria bacterium]|nr:hypothetical protein [Vicinamibacteria bacterium]
MTDPWNPTAAEIEEWAFDELQDEPCQGWDLALAWRREESLYLQIASNECCPRRRYFLHVYFTRLGMNARSHC